jgi:hypothetical protein
MDLAAYDTLTEELRDRLERDERALGLVLLGSTAVGADRWSDHDFFVVTVPGVQEELRTGLDWLPASFDPVLVLRETAHGLKVLGADGHLLELAVFDLDELTVASVNRYRVVLDRGGVTERMAEVASSSDARASRPPSLAHHFGMLVTCALVGGLRQRRGETLSGTLLVKSWALRHLLELVAAIVPSPGAARLDELDPFRRFEQAYPALGVELTGLMREEPDSAAIGLLELAEATLAPIRPELAWDALQVAVARIRQA